MEGARRLSFDADVLSLLPRDSRVIQAFRTFLSRFGSLDQLYVVFTAPEGKSVSEYADEIAAWTNALRDAPEIARVDAGVVDRTRDYGWLADHELRLQRIAASTRAAAAAVAREHHDEEPLPPLQVEFAGGHRIAIGTEAVVKRESIMNTVGSLALILPLLLIVFRSVWLVTVGSLPSLLSLVVVVGGLGFAGAKLSAAATGAAAMMFGLGVDGVVLLYVAHRLALAEDPAATVPAAIGGPSSSMLLGMWTTAATFYGLVFVDFPSLQQLGRLLGHSMIACSVLTLIMVPALLPRRAPRRTALVLSMPRFAGWIVRRRRTLVAASVLVTIALGIAAARIRINPTLDRLRSTTPAAQLEAKIGPRFGLPGDVDVVLA